MTREDGVSIDVRAGDRPSTIRLEANEFHVWLLILRNGEIQIAQPLSSDDARRFAANLHALADEVDRKRRKP